METHKLYRFEGLLQHTGWVSPAYVGVSAHGKVLSISTEKPENTTIEIVDGYAIPGFQNAHSHAFQYAMAGLAEIHPKGKTSDDFWTWRETMYHIALTISPQELEQIASMLYAEMLRHGYTHVAEFHYLHHDKNGQRYAQRAEMSERLMHAAQKTGIKLTLVPIFYQKGGFGQAPSKGQRRFIHTDSDDYLKLIGDVKNLATQYGQSWAPGIHSIRAVDLPSMVSSLQNFQNLPIHIHIAEQLKEIDDSIAYYGKRPVAWLFDHFDVNENWHLVHATHLDDDELALIAQSQAHVVLCPSTEGNLGDGIFRLNGFLAANGQWSIGTDSHVGLDPKEELRILDYGQRLISHQRNTFVNDRTGDSALSSFSSSLTGGRRAMGNTSSSFFENGAPFDAVVIDRKHPLIACSGLDKVLSTFIYSGDSTAVLGTLTSGEWRVKDNRHLHAQPLVADFKTALSAIKIRS